MSEFPVDKDESFVNHKIVLHVYVHRWPTIGSARETEETRRFVLGLNRERIRRADSTSKGKELSVLSDLNVSNQGLLLKSRLLDCFPLLASREPLAMRWRYY